MSCTKETCRPRSVFEELDRGLSQFVRGVVADDKAAAYAPRLTVFEMEDRYKVECDLPGVALENVELSVEDYVLTIKGQRKYTEADESVKVLLNERHDGEFSRRIRLAKNADVAAVEAELSNGMLVVTIMKRSEVLPKKIQIRRSESQS